MAMIFRSRVRETSNTTGTGPLTLTGAVAGYQAFSTVCSTSDTFFYAAVASATSWETGVGTYSSANTLTRTTVLESSNAGAAVSFAAGAKDVFIGSAPIRESELFDATGHANHVRWDATQTLTGPQAAQAQDNLLLADIASSGSASDLVAGTVPTARLGTGTADATSILYGDRTYKTADQIRYAAQTLTAPQKAIARSNIAIATATGVFKNLSIKVASNTTVTVAADFVIVANGSDCQAVTIAATVNLGVNGAVNRLDAGTIAQNTWYAIWAIAKEDGTAGALASTSATNPTLPTGYTYKARIGWVQTINGSATLYGTWQLGRKAQYVVGLAGTTNLPTIANGITSGSIGIASITWPAATSVVRFVPPTASHISVIGVINYNGGAGSYMAVAPSGSYGASQSLQPAPISTLGFGNNTQFPATFMLESTNIYFVSSAEGGGVFCTGWEDNI